MGCITHACHWHVPSKSQARRTDNAARGGQNYAIPHLTVESRLVRCNLPPRTIMRGPGTMQAVLLIEHVVDRVAAYLGFDPCLVRERNLLKHPKLEGAEPHGCCCSVCI